MIVSLLVKTKTVFEGHKKFLKQEKIEVKTMDLYQKIFDPCISKEKQFNIDLLAYGNLRRNLNMKKISIQKENKKVLGKKGATLNQPNQLTE